jgi:hypothetical protein
MFERLARLVSPPATEGLTEDDYLFETPLLEGITTLGRDVRDGDRIFRKGTELVEVRALPVSVAADEEEEDQPVYEAYLASDPDGEPVYFVLNDLKTEWRRARTEVEPTLPTAPTAATQAKAVAAVRPAPSRSRRRG